MMILENCKFRPSPPASVEMNILVLVLNSCSASFRSSILIYFENHKNKRLDITEAQRRGKIQEGRALISLRKLRSIEILSTAKLTDIENEMSSIKVCYELTPEELKSTHICPHCHYHLDDKVKNVYGVLDSLEIRIDDLLAEWTKTLSDTISDPIVASQKKFLSAEQQQAIDDFIASGTLPKRVDDFFVKAIDALLKGFEPVVIDTDDLMAKLEQMSAFSLSAERRSLSLPIIKEYEREFKCSHFFISSVQVFFATLSGAMTSTLQTSKLSKSILEIAVNVIEVLPSPISISSAEIG